MLVSCLIWIVMIKHAGLRVSPQHRQDYFREELETFMKVHSVLLGARIENELLRAASRNKFVDELYLFRE